MDNAHVLLILLSSSFFGFITRSKALKYQRNPRLWFWLGFIFGLWGLIAFYVSKLRPINRVQGPVAATFHLEPGPWYYSENQTIQGPVSDQFIHELFKLGKITLENRVWHESMSEWKKLEFFRK